MPPFVSRDLKKVLSLLSEHEAVLDPSFVKCIRTMLNMIQAMHQELIHYHLLREDKRQHILDILNDILQVIKDFQDAVNTEIKRYATARARLPGIAAPVGVCSYIQANELAKSIELWRKVLPWSRNRSRHIEYEVLERVANFYHLLLYKPLMAREDFRKHTSSTALRTPMYKLSFDFDDLIISYFQLNQTCDKVDEDCEAALTLLRDKREDEEYLEHREHWEATPRKRTVPALELISPLQLAEEEEDSPADSIFGTDEEPPVSPKTAVKTQEPPWEGVGLGVDLTGQGRTYDSYDKQRALKPKARRSNTTSVLEPHDSSKKNAEIHRRSQSESDVSSNASSKKTPKAKIVHRRRHKATLERIGSTFRGIREKFGSTAESGSSSPVSMSFRSSSNSHSRRGSSSSGRLTNPYDNGSGIAGRRGSSSSVGVADTRPWNESRRPSNAFVASLEPFTHDIVNEPEELKKVDSETMPPPMPLESPPPPLVLVRDFAPPTLQKFTSAPTNLESSLEKSPGILKAVASLTRMRPRQNTV